MTVEVRSQRRKEGGQITELTDAITVVTLAIQANVIWTSGNASSITPNEEVNNAMLTLSQAAISSISSSTK